VPRRAQVVRFNGLSAHADRDDLLSYFRAISPRPSRVFVVHGEDRQAFSLAAAIRAEHLGLEVTVPDTSTIYDL
jgi:metallo-beta-lactamase family protein